MASRRRRDHAEDPITRTREDPIIGVPCDEPYRLYRKTEQRYDGAGRLVSRSESFDDGPINYKQLETLRIAYEDWNGIWPAVNRVITEQRIDSTAQTQWTRSEQVLDGLGRKTQQVDRTFDPSVPDAVSRYGYDARGLATVAWVPDPSRNDGALVAYRYEYDGLGRLSSISHSTGIGGIRRVTYDGLWTETSLEPGDQGPAARVRYKRDVFGRVVRVEERTGIGAGAGAPAVTDYGYDGNGHLASVLDGDGLQTSLGNDRAGNRLWIERGGRRWDYQYDLLGRVTFGTVPHPPGQASAYTSRTEYDRIGRVLRRTPAPGALSAAEQSELRLGPVEYVYDTRSDAIGLPAAVWSPAWVEEFRYDARGRVTSATQRFSVPGGPTDARTATSQYNALGAPTQQTHGDGTTVTYQYDRRGLVRGATALGRQLFNQSRNSAGLVTARTLNPSGSPHWATWDYDQLGRLANLQVTARTHPFFPAVAIARQSHGYYASGDVRHVDELIGSRSRAFDYAYDHQSQLRFASDNRGYRGSYDFTPAGRMLAADVDLPTGADLVGRDVTYDYDDLDPERLRVLLDRQTGADVVRLAHDEAGNIVGKVAPTGSRGFTYDGDGKLRIATRGSDRERYFYDANGQRVLAIRNAGAAVAEVRRTFEDLEVETNAGVTTTRLTVSAGVPVARVVNASQIQYLHHNATGNLLIAISENGTILAGFSYGAFGEVLEQQQGASQFERRYQDREKDVVSGWYDYGARLYDPETMQWNRSDPLFRFVPEAAGLEPRRLGLYVFSLNNPLRYVDPDGRDPFDSQNADVPPEVAYLQGVDNGAVIAESAMIYAQITGELLKQYDLTGIADAAEVAQHLMHGDYRAALTGALKIGATWGVGYGIGKVVGVGFKLGARFLAKHGDEAAEAVVLAAGNGADEVGEVVGAGGWDVDVKAVSIARNGSRNVIGQGIGTKTCGPTCVEMTMDTLGREVQAHALQPFRTLAEKNGGLAMDKVADALEKQGVPAISKRATDFAELERLTSRGTPVITAMDVKRAHHTHAVIVDGVTTRPGVGRVVAIRDPADNGAQFFLPYSSFMRKWTMRIVHPVVKK